MLQPRGELDLPAEPLDVEARGQLRRQHLQHDRAAERELARHEDPTHAGAAELVLEHVPLAQRAVQVGAEGARRERLDHGGNGGGVATPRARDAVSRAYGLDSAKVSGVCWLRAAGCGLRAAGLWLMCFKR